MTIRLYPSRLPGQPLETHEHDTISIRDWLVKMSKTIPTENFHLWLLNWMAYLLRQLTGLLRSSSLKAMLGSIRFPLTP